MQPNAHMHSLLCQPVWRHCMFTKGYLSCVVNYFIFLGWRKATRLLGVIKPFPSTDSLNHLPEKEKKQIFQNAVNYKKKNFAIEFLKKRTLKVALVDIAIRFSIKWFSVQTNLWKLWKIGLFSQIEIII